MKKTNAILPWPPQLNQSMVLTAKIALIASATIALYFQDLVIIFSDALQNEANSYLLAIPILFIYLLYRKREILRAVASIESTHEPKNSKHVPTIAGVLLLLLAILVHQYGSLTFSPLIYHVFAIPVFITGLCLIFFNIQTVRQLAFPIAFLLLLTPPPSEILYAIGSTLSFITSKASFLIVRSLGVQSTLTTEYGNPLIQITRPNGSTMSFAVDIACSGIYSLLGFAMFAVFIAYIIRDKTWKRLSVFVIGIPLIYVMNITRVTTILLLGYYSKENVVQFFHLLGGGFLVFAGALLLLLVTEKGLKAKIFANTERKCTECSPEPMTNQDLCLTCGRILKPIFIKIDKSH